MSEKRLVFDLEACYRPVPTRKAQVEVKDYPSTEKAFTASVVVVSN
jgi:hypothetical protein